MSTLFTNRRVTHLRFADAIEKIRNIGEKFGQHRNCFGNFEIVQGGNCKWLLIRLTNMSRGRVLMFVNRINKY